MDLVTQEWSIETELERGPKKPREKDSGIKKLKIIFD